MRTLSGNGYNGKYAGFRRLPNYRIHLLTFQEPLEQKYPGKVGRKLGRRHVSATYGHGIRYRIANRKQDCFILLPYVPDLE
jgi:hypothetical protein